MASSSSTTTTTTTTAAPASASAARVTTHGHSPSPSPSPSQHHNYNHNHNHTIPARSPHNNNNNSSSSPPERTGLNFRSPSTSITSTPSDFVPPSVSFLQGLWHVTHSTLPMWKSNRNVTITYRSLPNNAEVLDDLVEYQPLTSEKRKKVEGVDTPDAEVVGAYSWRGRGLLKIASSHWQVLGYGDEDGGWAVTYFQKTLFTPAGLDVYARRKGGLSEELLEQIRDEIRNVQAKEVRRLAELLFEIQHNW